MGCSRAAVKSSGFWRLRPRKEFHLLSAVKSTGSFRLSGIRRRCPQQPAIRRLEPIEANRERLVDARIVDQAFGRPVGDDLAAVDHDHALEEAEGEIEIVHDHDRQPVGPPRQGAGSRRGDGGCRGWPPARRPAAPADRPPARRRAARAPARRPTSVDQRRRPRRVSSNFSRRRFDGAGGQPVAAVGAQPDQLGDAEIPVRLEVLRQVADRAGALGVAERREIAIADLHRARTSACRCRPAPSAASICPRRSGR